MELEDIHVAILLFTAVVILYADHEGLSYFRQKKLVLTKKFVTWSHRLVWLGLTGMIVSGVLLMAPRWEFWLQDPTFYVKMGFVLTLLINGFFIGRLAHSASETPYALLSKNDRMVLMISGSLSLLGWGGASIIGFFFL